MATRIIRKRDDPALREKCRPVKEIDGRVINILEDMAETMYQSQGVGLAANQVGIPKQLMVIDTGETGLLELINPRLLQARGEEVDVEGCLSFPGMQGEVKRARGVTVEALDREGKTIRVEGEGLLARVLQHEMDHLSGILLVDRAEDFYPLEEKDKKKDKKREKRWLTLKESP